MIYAFTKYAGYKRRVSYRVLKPAIERLAKAKMKMIQDKYKSKVYFISTLQYPLLSFNRRCFHIDIVTSANIKNHLDVIEVEGIRYQVYLRYHQYYPATNHSQPSMFQSTVSEMLRNNHFELYWLFHQLTMESSSFVYVDSDFRAMIVNLFTHSTDSAGNENKLLYRPDINDYLIKLFQGWDNNASHYFGSMFDEEYLSAYNYMHERFILLSRIHTLSFILGLTLIALKEKYYTSTEKYLMALDNIYQSYFDIKHPIRKYNDPNITVHVDFEDDYTLETALLLDRVNKLINEAEKILTGKDNNTLYDEIQGLIDEVKLKIKNVYIKRLQRIRKDFSSIDTDIK